MQIAIPSLAKVSNRSPPGHEFLELEASGERYLLSLICMGLVKFQQIILHAFRVRIWRSPCSKSAVDYLYHQVFTLNCSIMAMFEQYHGALHLNRNNFASVVAFLRAQQVVLSTILMPSDYLLSDSRINYLTQ